METPTTAPGTVSHERPVLDATPTAPSADHGPSEYEQHRIARGMTDKVPVAPETPAAEARTEPETPGANPLAGAPEPAEEPEPLEAAETPKGPEATNHRWKDPDTGVTLDMRRRDHRRIRKLLEERAELSRRVAQPVYQPQPQPEQARPQVAPQARVDPNDPKPTLDQYADQPDPYAAHGEAVAEWKARQTVRQEFAARASVERTRRTAAAIDSRQSAFDAKLPEIRERFQDFDQAHDELHGSLARVPVPVRGPIVHALLTSPIGHELAYYLGNHPQELARLTHARSPHEQARHLGALEARVQHTLRAGPAQASTTRATAPITPVNTGGPTARRDAGEIAKQGDYQAYRAARGMPGTAQTATR